MVMLAKGYEIAYRLVEIFFIQSKTNEKFQNWTRSRLPRGRIFLHLKCRVFHG